jgi:hypothetical protein
MGFLKGWHRKVKNKNAGLSIETKRYGQETRVGELKEAIAFLFFLSCPIHRFLPFLPYHFIVASSTND